MKIFISLLPFVFVIISLVKPFLINYFSLYIQLTMCFCVFFNHYKYLMRNYNLNTMFFATYILLTYYMLNVDNNFIILFINSLTIHYIILYIFK